MTATIVKEPIQHSFGLARWVSTHSLLTYFGVAFIGTWLFFLPIIYIFSTGQPNDAVTLFFLLSIFGGPTLAAFLVTALSSGPAGVRALLSRIVRWRVGAHWYLVALFSFFAIWLAGFSILFGAAPVRALLEQPQVLVTTFLPAILFGTFIPALGEEIGWRGFALPELQRRYGALVGTLILGTLHSIWHLPVFFTPVLGPFTVERFAPFVITAIAGTFIYTWIFNNSRKSVLIAALIHAASNASSGLLPTLLPASSTANESVMSFVSSGWLNVVLFSAAALLLVLVTRGRLSYQADNAD